jgi:hypothetical protein
MYSFFLPNFGGLCSQSGTEEMLFFFLFFPLQKWLLSLTMALIDVDHGHHSIGKQGRLKAFSMAFTFKAGKMQAREFLSVFKACCLLLLQMLLPQ